jgi:hypothetical protein
MIKSKLWSIVAVIFVCLVFCIINGALWTLLQGLFPAFVILFKFCNLGVAAILGIRIEDIYGWIKKD